MWDLVFFHTQSHLSPVPELSFLSAPYRGWTRASERRVQDNLHAHAQNAAIFPPKLREKPYLEVLSRFGLWRDWLKTCKLMPNQWNFTSATLNRIRFGFYHNIKICWQLKTPTRTWKCTRCIMQMNYLYASDVPFKNVCKLAQHGETIRKKMFKSTDHDKAHFHSYVFMFFTTISASKKMCFLFSERELKKAMRDTLTQAAWYGL